MDEERVKQIVSEMRFDSGKGDMAIDEMAVIQPGLARIMPEIGARVWKLYYAGKAENWPYAMYQWKEARKLFELAQFTRPKYEESIEEYLRDDFAPIEGAIRDQSVEKFLAAIGQAVDSANAWHEKKDKPYIRWKVPDTPPPDLDLTPRK